MFKTYTQFLFLILISNSNIALSAQNDDFSIEESNSPNQQVAMNSHDDKKFLPNSETIKTPPVNNIPSDNITSSGCMTDINSCIIDLDRDGVLNNSDECPNTPLGVPVNEIGCGIDNDKDGVFDVVDNCLNTPPNTRIDMNGCAWDSDRDVVADYKDHCPKTPKGHMVNLIGCSLDDDEDGIYNVYDECPNTKPGTKVNPVGCAIFYKFVLNDVYFNNLITGYACGDNGLILKTENAGESWTGIDLNIEEDFYSIYSIEDDTLWIVGSNNTVLKSIDNGITWNAIIIQDQYNYTWKNIQFTSPLIGYLSGGINDYLGDIFKTTDGGNSWEIINPENSGFLDDIQSMQFLNDSVGWIYSYFVSTAGQIPEGYPYLYKTTNGGVNWEDLVPRQPFFFLNDSIGWGSSTGYTYITYDGGASWNNPVSQYSALTYKFLDNQNGWAAGEYGYLGYTNNGGDNWTDFNGYKEVDPKNWTGH